MKKRNVKDDVKIKIKNHIMNVHKHNFNDI